MNELKFYIGFIFFINSIAVLFSLQANEWVDVFFILMFTLNYIISINYAGSFNFFEIYYTGRNQNIGQCFGFYVSAMAYYVSPLIFELFAAVCIVGINNLFSLPFNIATWVPIGFFFSSVSYLLLFNFIQKQSYLNHER